MFWMPVSSGQKWSGGSAFFRNVCSRQQGDVNRKTTIWNLTALKTTNVRHGVILIIKPTGCTKFSNLFWNETLHVSDSSSVHHQEFFTIHTATVYVIQVCRLLSSRIRLELQFNRVPARKLSTKLCDIYHCCVYSEKLLMMDRGTVRNMLSFIPKYWEISASSWIYYKDLSRCTVTRT
jgi:hypothetical protein